MAALLAFGWLFWAVFFFGVVVVSLASHDSKNASTGYWATIVAGLFAISVLLLYLAGYGITDAWSYVKTNTMDIVTALFIYIGLGICYSAIRWYFRLRKIKSMFVEYKSSHSIGEDIKTRFVRDELSYKRLGSSFPPRVSEHRDELIHWMVLWVFCLINLKPLTALYNFIYLSIAGAFQSMSDRMFKDV